MASGYRYSSKRLPVVAASAGITSGNVVVQESIFGIALSTVLTGASLWISGEGVWNIPVPAGAASKGTKVYMPGAPPTAGVNIVLTVTQAANTLFGITLSARDANGFALVLMAAQMAATVTT